MKKNNNCGFVVNSETVNAIPQTKAFHRIIQCYLLECPVRTRIQIPVKDRDPNDPQAKYKCLFKKVSKRGTTFYERGLDGSNLNVLRAAMKRVTDVKLIVVDTVNEVTSVSAELDLLAEQEYIIIKRNEGNVSVTEGYFYCIRNAFAHGNFDVDGSTYYLRNEVHGEIRGVARLLESSLIKWSELINMSIGDIKSAGRKNN